MKAIIAYDLINVKDGDHRKVKAALDSFINTISGESIQNSFSAFAEWIRLKLPDTTILCFVAPGQGDCRSICDHVIEVIHSVGATPDKVYVGFVGDDFLWNANPQRGTLLNSGLAGLVGNLPG